MEATPGTPAKRPRAKAKESAQSTTSTTITKKPRARKAAAADVAASAVTRSTPAIPSSDEIEGMIATTAYYIAAERNFTPGHELDDWLEAERRVRATVFG